MPTSADTVTFDTASNATAYTVTITATANCSDISFGNPLVGALTFAGSSSLNVYGSFTIVSTITRTYTGAITFAATATGKTITTNSVTLANAVTFNGVGGGWTLQDAFTNSSSNILVEAGILDTNGKNVSCYTFGFNGTTARTITLGASTITVANNWYFPNTTNLTFNVNTSTIVITANGTFTGAGLTYNVVQLTGTQPTIVGVNTFATLTRIGTATKTDSLILGANQTITGTLTLNGNSVTERLLVQSDTVGIARTLTAATVTVTNADFQDITGTGAGSWNLSAISGASGDCGGNSGITFTTPITTNWTSGATWSTATWSFRVPLPQDTATFTTAGVATITQDMPRIGGVDFTGSTNKTWTTSTTATCYGSINLTNLATLTASSQAYTMGGRGSYTLTSAGFIWNRAFTIETVTGALTLLDNFETGASRSLNFNSGTFSANNFNVTAGSFSTSGFITNTINMGSGTWTLTTTTAGVVSANAAGVSVINCNTSTIKITGTGVKTFSGGGKIYYNVWFARGTEVGAVTIAGSNTFSDFKDDGSVAHSILFTAGTTQTVSTFTVTGTAGNVITLNSTTTATHALVKSGGGTISCDYLNIQHSVATPATTWYAGVNSVNNQAVATAGSGWIFTAPPAGGVNTGAGFFMMM